MQLGLYLWSIGQYQEQHQQQLVTSLSLESMDQLLLLLLKDQLGSLYGRPNLTTTPQELLL